MHSFSKYFLFILLSFPVYASDKFFRFDDPDNGFQDFIDDSSGLLVVEEKIIDVPYEKGKSIFYGRGNSPKLPYCVRNDTKIVKVKRSSMKIYKHALSSELADKLYHCDEPDRKIINELSRNDFIYVMYYLNAEYKLYLKRE